MKNISLYNKLFIVFISVVALSIAVIAWYGMQSTSKAYINSANERAYKNGTLVEVEIEGEFAYIPNDLLYISDFYALKKFLAWRSMGEYTNAKKWKHIFTDTLRDFIRTKKTYYKARVIDIDGNEIINITYDNKTEKINLVEDLKLQNKSNKDYVRLAKNLKKGEIYISAMDLNMENSKVVFPYLPVVRFSTPIMGVNDEVVAFYVVSVYADHVLNSLKEKSQNESSQGISYFLIDAGGNYLYHENESKRWNPQLKNGANFNKDYFNIKDKFSNLPHGSFSHEKKIYSFHKVHPSEMYSSEYWYIVSSIDESVALMELEQFRYLFVILICIMILVSFFLIRTVIKKITQPLALVSKQLKKLSVGEIQKEDIVYKNEDEVGDIVRSSAKVIDSIEKVIKQANSVADGKLGREFKLLGENDQLGRAINEMTQRLQEIESMAQKLSVGNYDTNIIVKNLDDKLGLALIDMIQYLKSITRVAESISQGDIDIEYKVISKEDRLGLAMLEMVAYLKTILNQANAISREDFSQSLVVKSSADELGSAMVTMTNILSETYINNKNEIYFSEGVGEFGEALSSADNLENLANIAVLTACRYVEAASGVLYLYEHSTQKLNLQATYALELESIDKESYALGDGIIGQVGVDKKFILLKDTDDNSYNIKTATTLSSPKEILVFPLLNDGKLFGVLELLSFTKFSEINIDYLLKTANMFAVSIHTTNQNIQIKELLEKSQRAFEELQTQSEELQETNVQMEEQQQQLTIQSIELKDKNKTLEHAKDEIDKRANELEKASKYKSEFLANMSHELRTPLNSIILLSKLLSQSTDNTLAAKDREKAKVINKSGNDLLYLINDILDLTKIESGNMELEINEVFSADLIASMKDIFTEVAKEKKIDFIVEDRFNSSFISDQQKLEQVLKNLLSNAIKFTNKGSVVFNIDKDENNFKIVVQDTGVGVAKDKQKSIFEAFRQADGSVSREFGGTGLGLSITKTIVELMDGHISIESELGKGTTFVVTLPVEKSVREEFVDLDNAAVVTSIIENEFQDELEHELSGKNILIVDDDSRNIFSLTSLLESSGAEVYSAFNGQEAIDVLSEEVDIIDLILMDIMMPVMDGLTAIKIIKATEEYKDIPLIAITARTTPEDKQECLDSGADEYLSKPVEYNALFAMMKAWIR